MDIKPETVRNSYRAQAQRSQTHRWLASCLNPATPIAELFSDRLQCTLNGEPLSLVGTHLSLHSAQAGAILELGSGDGTCLQVLLDGLQIERNRPAHPTSIHLGFDSIDSLLPLITRIDITQPVTLGSTLDLTPANEYAPHRLLALKHRWHALVESPTKHSAAFQAIITNDFTMDWRQGSVRGYAELANWVTGTAASINAARHDIAAFGWSNPTTGSYEAEFEFDWSGISADDKQMRAKSRHIWRVEDNPTETYARIARMDVEFLVPFHIVEGIPE